MNFFNNVFAFHSSASILSTASPSIYVTSSEAGAMTLTSGSGANGGLCSSSIKLEASNNGVNSMSVAGGNTAYYTFNSYPSSPPTVSSANEHLLTPAGAYSKCLIPCV